MRCDFFQYQLIRPTRPRQYWAYHDEILPARGTQAHQFLVHGVLFVSYEDRKTVLEKLSELRGGYEGELHHRDLKAKRGPRFEAAQRWLQWFKGEGLRYLVIKVFAADQQGFRQLPYPGDADYFGHLWQNTLTSFVAGIRWGLPEAKCILLRVVCDDTGNEDFENVLAGLPVALAKDMRARRARTKARQAKAARHVRLAPLVRVLGPIRTVSSNPRQSPPEDRGHSEMLQLTDLMLGVLWDAVEARRVSPETQAGRVRLVRQMRETDQPGVLLPWAARLPIARRVSVSIWPDEHNRTYTATVMRERPGQQPLPMAETFFSRRSRAPDIAHLNHESPAADAPAGIGVVDAYRPKRPTDDLRSPVTRSRGSPAHRR